MFSLPTADTYGTILINAAGHVLLREPKGHFGGYVWTFAKGRPDKGETPSRTALRETREETGYDAEILDVIAQVFPGTTSTSAFFIAGPVGKQGRFSDETAATRWVSFDDALALIGQTTTSTGRNRDLAILRAAREVHARMAWSKRPATCKEDWNTRPLPRKRTEIALDLHYDAGAMARIRKGFLPAMMEEKWFVWFDSPVLHLHRSWTGICIYQVRFQPDGDGWRATSAKVNRNPGQYTETDDETDRRLIADLVDGLLVHGPEGPRVDPIAQAIRRAGKNAPDS
jgi:8-oxo-dGTP pyrophosphatase MutT (NUDIX family)